MNELERLYAEHIQMKVVSYAEDMNKMMQQFESFVDDSLRIFTDDRPKYVQIAEALLYKKGADGEYQSYTQEIDDKLAEQMMWPVLAYLPNIKSEGSSTEEFGIEMLTLALQDPDYIAYLKKILLDHLSTSDTNSDITQNVDIIIKNFQHEPDKSLRSELEKFIHNVLMGSNIVDKIVNFDLLDDQYETVFKRKIIGNIKANKKSWDILLKKIYPNKDNQDKTLEDFYRKLVLPEEKDLINSGDNESISGDNESISGDNESISSDEEVNELAGVDDEQAQKDIEAQQEQWKDIGAVWDALKRIEVNKKPFVDVIYNTLKSAEPQLTRVLNERIRALSPKEGLIFKKGYSQQIVTSFIQTIVLMIINDTVYRSTIVGATPSVQSVKEKYAKALNNTLRSNRKDKEQVLNRLMAKIKKALPNDYSEFENIKDHYHGN